MPGDLSAQQYAVDDAKSKFWVKAQTGWGTLSVPGLNSAYELRDLSFHVPAQHVLDGQRHAGELIFFFQRKEAAEIVADPINLRNLEEVNFAQTMVNQLKNTTNSIHEVVDDVLTTAEDWVDQGKKYANQAKETTASWHEAIQDQHNAIAQQVDNASNVISGGLALGTLLGSATADAAATAVNAVTPTITMRNLAETEETEETQEPEDFQAVTDGLESLEYLVVEKEQITIRALEEDEENQQGEPQMVGISIPIDVVKHEESPFFQDLLEGNTLSSNVLLQVLTNPSLTYSSYVGSDVNQGDHACKTPVTYMLVDQPLTLSADQMADFMIQIAEVTMHEPNQLTLLRNSMMQNEKCKERTGLGLTATMSLIAVAIFATLAMLVGGFLFYRWQKSRDALNSRRQARGIPVVHTV